MNTDKEKQENAPIPIITESEGIHWMHVIKTIEILKDIHMEFTINRIQKYLSVLKEPINLSIQQIELIMDEMHNIGLVGMIYKGVNYKEDPNRVYIYVRKQ